MRKLSATQKITSHQSSQTPAPGSFLHRPLDAEHFPSVEQVEAPSRFIHYFANVPVHSHTPIQPKLTIGQVGDKYEQEADQIAAIVVKQINTPSVTPINSIQRTEIPEEDELMMKPESCIQRLIAPTLGKKLQTKSILQLQADGTDATEELESSIQQARSGGQGLADNIRKPMERAFGADFSGVKVHTDAVSDRLNQSIQAKAFTTGQDIFFQQGAYQLGNKKGHELLAHELTHVVQQNGRAVQRSPQQQEQLKQKPDRKASSITVKGRQNNLNTTIKQTLNTDKAIIQLVTNNGGKSQTSHLLVGDFFQSKVNELKGKASVIIELIEKTQESALAKIQEFVNTSGIYQKVPVAFVIGLNCKSGDNTIEKLTDTAINIATMLEKVGLEGGCFPFIWAPTGNSDGGYTFPFLEARALMTLHDGVKAVHKRMESLSETTPIVRGMDGDVSLDPLLTSNAEQEASWNPLRERLSELAQGKYSILSGGYRWNEADVESKTKTYVPEIKNLINVINKHEQQVRVKLSEEINFRAIYWPEPNVYMPLHLRQQGAMEMMKDPSIFSAKDSQQKESTHYVKQNIATAGKFDPAIATVKPLKTYFDKFIEIVSTSLDKKTAPSKDQMINTIKEIRQTHLNPAAISDNYKWNGMSESDYKLIKEAIPIVEKHLQACAVDLISFLKDYIALIVVLHWRHLQIIVVTGC